MFDVIVVGARCAGASTSLLLARKGLKVLMVDKVQFPKDTLSTHFLWPRGASYLNRFGLLDSVREFSPTGTSVHVGIEDFQMTSEVSLDHLTYRFEQLHGNSENLTQEYLSSRRYLLDDFLSQQAVLAGVEFRPNFVVTGLIKDGDRVCGIKGRNSDGAEIRETAKVVIGADGKASTVARHVGAERREVRPACSFAHFSYFSGFDLGGVTIQKRGRLSLGIVKTSNQQNMTLVFGPKDWFSSYKGDPKENFIRTLSHINPEIGEIVATQGVQEERFYGTNDMAGFIRTSSGPGWALIGDAACFKDQCTASGMTHAFRDAELVSDHVFAGLVTGDLESELREYSRKRFVDSWRYYEFVCQQAEMNPARVDELQLLKAVTKNQKYVERFIGMYADTYPVKHFFSKRHTKEILGETLNEVSDFSEYRSRVSRSFLNPFSGQTEVSGEDIALSQTCADFTQPVGSDIVARTEDYYQWQHEREVKETWQYSRTLHAFPGPITELRDDFDRAIHGINFASQDYLGMGAHPRIREAALKALDQFGPHSAGSPMIIGNTTLSQELERKLSEMLELEHVMIFPTGWAAGFGTIAGLVRPNDHIVMDKLSHACLQMGANSVCRNIHRHPHLDVEAARALLAEIRATDKQNAILVISEGLFSMDSDVPDLVALQEVCHEFGARLMVDVAHDFGSMGPKGSGQLGVQGLLGKVDLVMGSFSKSFASNGGFLASNSPAVKQYVKMFGNTHLFSNALSPIQTAVALESANILSSSEGDALRGKLMNVVHGMRDTFSHHGIDCLGRPSAIVPVPIGDEKVARVVHRLCRERNIATMILEYPVVATGSSRFRLQVMATHELDQAVFAATQIVEMIAEAREYIHQKGKGLTAHPLQVS